MLGLEVKQKAEGDNSEVIAWLDRFYFLNGNNGFEEENKLSHHWFGKSVDLWSTHGIGIMGSYFLVGEGHDKNVSHSTTLTARASVNVCVNVHFCLGSY